MVSDNGYKLIVYPKAETMRLFDLTNDPGERFDLADKPEHQATKWRLFDRLLVLQKQMGDQLDLSTLRNDRQASR